MDYKVYGYIQQLNYHQPYKLQIEHHLQLNQESQTIHFAFFYVL